MKLTFFWSEFQGHFHPACRCELVNSRGFSPLGELLTDTGGLPADDAIAWRTEALTCVDSVLNGVTAAGDWATETFCCEFNREEANVSEIDDEEDAVTLSTTSFRKALEGSIEFFKSSPASDYHLEVNV